MRAFLVMLMFTLLPLQFSAAAAAGCDHVGLAPAMAAHHQPTHLLPGQETQERADNATGNAAGFDLDGGTCHAHCAAALSTTTATTVDAAGIERAEHLAEPILPPWQERPYRPQWSAPTSSG
jgi:hypothetical protein